MKLCFVADSRSPIARGWIEHLARTSGFEIHVVSLYPSEPVAGTTTHTVPLFPSIVTRSSSAATSQGPDSSSGGVLNSTKLRFLWWSRVAPVWAAVGSGRLRRVIAEIAPDLVHVMRIPVEAEVVSLADIGVPLVVSTWGNDFTLWARYRVHRLLTKRLLERTNLLLCDSERDIQIARELGYPADRPARNLPVAGGVRTELFSVGSDVELRAQEGISPEATVVLNPRGMRPYIRNDTFIRSAAAVAMQRDSVTFAWAGLSPEQRRAAEELKRQAGVEVVLFEQRDHDQVARLFRMSDIVVSPAEHDGIPNTLLEAMACGSFPIASDLPSIREWVEHGRNGFLFDPTDSDSLTAALLAAIDQEEWRRSTTPLNRSIVVERAGREAIMSAAETMYRELATVGGRS